MADPRGPSSIEPRRHWSLIVLMTLCGIVVIAIAGTAYAYSARPVPQAAVATKPDPAVLGALHLSARFKPVKDAPGCFAVRLTRCFKTDLTGPKAAGIMTSLLSANQFVGQIDHFGTQYDTCGTLGGAPAFASVRPWLVGSVRQGHGSWKLPSSNHPQIGGYVVLVHLGGQVVCG